MEKKRKEKGWAAEALQKYSRNGLVSKNFVFSFQSGYIFNKLFHFWLINVRLAGKETDFFYHVYVFFSVGEELTLLSLHGKMLSWSGFIATSDDTRGLFAGNFRSLSCLKFLFPLRKLILFSFTSLGHFEPLAGWISLEMPHLLPFISHTRSWRCLWHRGHTTDRKLFVSSPVKGSPFFRSFFSLGTRKCWGLVAFWNCLCTRKWRNTSISSVLLSFSKRLCRVFIPLCLVLMLLNSYQAFTHKQFETRLLARIFAIQQHLIYHIITFSAIKLP